jgi:hypothetical protein
VKPHTTNRLIERVGEPGQRVGRRQRDRRGADKTVYSPSCCWQEPVGVCTSTDSEPNVSTIRGAMREQRRSVVTEEQRSIRPEQAASSGQWAYSDRLLGPPKPLVPDRGVDSLVPDQCARKPVELAGAGSSAPRRHGLRSIERSPCRFSQIDLKGRVRATPACPLAGQPAADADRWKAIRGSSARLVRFARAARPRDRAAPKRRCR